VKAFWGRICLGIACLGGAVFSSPNLFAADNGLIGSKLSAAEKTDFFVFFNFAPVGEAKQADGTRDISFKPTGDAFKALVTLEVHLNASEVITKIDLVVARSFIDDPKNGIYAADLVKSFLGSAAATSAGDEVKSLAIEINARTAMKMSGTLLTAQPLPQVSATPSAAYQTYAGNPQQQTLVYPSGQVQVVLRNGPRSGQSVLEVVASPVAKGT
jgi:hypothetical protein